MRTRKLIIAAGAVLALLPLQPSAAATNPLGASSGWMRARGCYMTYSLTPTPSREIVLAGSLDCTSTRVYREVAVTVLDNGQRVDDGRLDGDPGCAFRTGAVAVGCRFPAEPGHVYTAQFEFYMENVEPNSLPYPNDPLNAGICSSDRFRATEIPYLTCTSTLNHLSR